MTIANVAKYDSERVAHAGNHAVVVGAGMAGLLAARVLADVFDRVTAVESDPLPDEPVPRRGAPQGHHAHLLQTAGREILEDLLPGFGEKLLSDGGLVIDTLSDLRHYEKGGVLADGSRRLSTYCATRPLIELTVRRCVSEFDSITIRSGCQSLGYLTDGASKDVEGIRLREPTGETADLTADLVVDATGRTSSTATWLADHGYARPAVDEVTIDLAYSSVTVRRPPDDRRTFLVPPDPPRTRGAAVLPVEDERWLVTMIGIHGDHPPTTPHALRAFADSLPIPAPSTILETRPWISQEGTLYPFPSNRRRRFEALDRFPDGLVVVGDALASFNPIYGQGMSVGALEALALHDTLATEPLSDLAIPYFERVADIVDVPWSLAVGGDFEFAETTGDKPFGTGALNRYVGHLIRAAQTDGQLRERLYRVFMLEAPPTVLFRPAVVWRALKPSGIME
jgi:2-polyprenyl-6-methoxyphenol hydroxylase-like FAD-dependent oxidoreductase